ncbi:MAG: hypothetical protein R3300_11110 [Candidatus Promineifilaceae bacterium]|nr:hypothetical protein [Candidatus Promineifilaceae bacterium]
MNNETSFRQITAITAILAAVLNVASTIIPLMALDFNFEFLADPGELLTAGLEPSAIELFHWGSVLVVFGWCLLFIPAALYLWFWLKPHSPGLVTLYTVLGLTGIVFCALVSAIGASFWPPMMAAYPQAAEAQREVLEVVFRAVTDFAFEGMYALNSILFGFWWLGIGLVLRVERRTLGIATAIMGVAILGAGIGWTFRVHPLARLEAFYFFEPIWAIWLGIVIWRRGEQGDHGMDGLAAT